MRLTKVKVKLGNDRSYLGQLNRSENLLFIEPVKLEHLDVDVLSIRNKEFKILSKKKVEGTHFWRLNLGE